MAIIIKKLLILILSLIITGSIQAKNHKNKRAVIVYDDSSGVILHEEHAHELRHPASLTKKMALYVIFKALRDKKIHFYTNFTISKRAQSQEPCSAGYKAGEKHAVIDLVKVGITQSANDGLVALAEGLSGSVEKFVQEMNKTARHLGMTKTTFYNSTGLPHPYQFTTAHDMLVLAKALVRDFPEYYQFFKTVQYSYRGRTFRNHNRMLESVEGMDGIKTGFINASGFNVSTSTTRNGRRIYVVFMGGSSWRARDKEVVGLIETAFRSPAESGRFMSLNIQSKQRSLDTKLAKTVAQSDCKNTASDPLTQYLNNIQSDSRNKTVKKSKNKKTIKAHDLSLSPKSQIISLSSIKPIICDEPKDTLVKTVLRKPIAKKSKKCSKRKKL